MSFTRVILLLKEIAALLIDNILQYIIQKRRMKKDKGASLVHLMKLSQTSRSLNVIHKRGVDVCFSWSRESWP